MGTNCCADLFKVSQKSPTRTHHLDPLLSAIRPLLNQEISHYEEKYTIFGLQHQEFEKKTKKI